MPRLPTALIVACLLACWTTAAYANESLEFQAKDLAGNPVQLAVPTNQSDKQFSVICFLGTECPLAKLYAGRLNRLSQEFDSVQFLGIASNQQDSADELKKYVQQHDLKQSLDIR